MARVVTWPRGVTVSTLDSESSDRGSNPREAFRARPFGRATVGRRNWPRGVTVSTLDPESSDRGLNPREAFGGLQPPRPAVGRCPAVRAASWCNGQHSGP